MIQYAALPYRLVAGDCRVLLVTSRETRRWIVPKGWPKPGIAPHDLAALEALEEAGVCGAVEPQPFGTFRYTKRSPERSCADCEVAVFLLAVEQELERWPERGQRERCWLAPRIAAERAGDRGLADLLRRFDRHLAGGPAGA